MMTEKIINLCDRNYIFVEKICKEKTYGNLVVSIGSYTCANYLIGLLDYNISFGEYDLVLPVFPERLLSILENEKLEFMCKKARNIVVNDIGFLSYFNRKSYKNIRLGRLFFREYKDHRYEEYHKSFYESKIRETIVFLRNMKLDFVAVEADIPTINTQFDVDCCIYIHVPYRQVSISHICEYASIGKAIEEKYIPDDKCYYQCFKQLLEYPVSGYYKVGKNVYDLIVLGLGDVEKYNIIETPRW